MQSLHHIPASGLPGTYKAAPKLWRHSLHTICSRVAMFPPQLTEYFIRNYSSEADCVADPWAGVGTVPLQACLDGRTGIGSDISPEAWVIMSAKLDPLTREEAMEYLGSVEKRMASMNRRHIDSLGTSIGVHTYYHTRTLDEVLKVRDILRKDRKSHNRSRRKKARFLMALMLGILHGDRPESLSLKMDSSKALSLVHVRSMQKRFPKEYVPHYRSVVESLSMKIDKVLKDSFNQIHGFAYNRRAEHLHLKRKMRLVITSPPYLGVHEYAYDNRARLWFLGYDYRLVRKRIFSTDSLPRYFAYLTKSLVNLSKGMQNDSTCVLVLGDIKKNGDIVRTGELFAAYWVNERRDDTLKLKEVIVDRVRPMRRRYFNLQAAEGIRCERLLIFHRGNPICNNIAINWGSAD